MACRTAAARVVCSPGRAVQARDGGGERQLVGPPGVHPTEQGIDEPVHHLVAKPRPYQRADRDVLTRAPSSGRPLSVSPPVMRARSSDGGRIGRHAHERARRDRPQRAVEGERGRNRRRVHQVVAETDPVRQCRARPSRGPGRGPGRSRRRSPPAGPANDSVRIFPPKPVGPLEHDDVDVGAQFPQPLRRGQSGDAATDHHDP